MINNRRYLLSIYFSLIKGYVCDITLFSKSDVVSYYLERWCRGILIIIKADDTEIFKKRDRLGEQFIIRNLGKRDASESHSTAKRTKHI